LQDAESTNPTGANRSAERQTAMVSIGTAPGAGGWLVELPVGGRPGRLVVGAAFDMQVNNDQDDRIPGNNMLSSDINCLYTDRQNSSVNINPEKKNSVQKRKIYTPFFILVSGRCDQASHG
jgi:hypothetical protein